MPRSPDYNDRTDEAVVPPRARAGERVQPVLKPNEARQGVTHLNMRYVLALSFVGIVLAFAIIYMLFFAGTYVDPTPLSDGPVEQQAAP